MNRKLNLLNWLFVAWNTTNIKLDFPRRQSHRDRDEQSLFSAVSTASWVYEAYIEHENVVLEWVWSVCHWSVHPLDCHIRYMPNAMPRICPSHNKADNQHWLCDSISRLKDLLLRPLSSEPGFVHWYWCLICVANTGLSRILFYLLFVK